MTAVASTRIWFGELLGFAILTVGVAPAARAQDDRLPPPAETTIGQTLCERIRRLSSEGSYTRDPHRADERRLLSPLITRRPDTLQREPITQPGVKVKIEPEMRAARGRANWLRDGRVLARITTDTAGGTYDPLGIRTGTQFVWVDSADTVRRTPQVVLGRRALMVHADRLANCNPNTSVVKLSLHIEPIRDHIPGRNRRWQALPSARFFFAAYPERGVAAPQRRTLFAESINETCPGGSCCSICGPYSFDCVTMHANPLRIP